MKSKKHKLLVLMVLLMIFTMLTACSVEPIKVTGLLTSIIITAKDPDTARIDVGSISIFNIITGTKETLIEKKITVNVPYLDIKHLVIGEQLTLLCSYDGGLGNIFDDSCYLDPDS